MGKFVDRTGIRYGRLVATKIAGRDKSGHILWYCDCDCGTKDCIVSGSHLSSNHTQSCGCFFNEIIQVKGCNNKKYNKYDLTGEYGIGWTINTNKEFYFDLEDYDKIKDYCWYEHKTKDKQDGYILARELKNNKSIRLHRLIMGITDSQIKIDHIKHKLYDNRKSQLRICKNQDNCLNHVIYKNNTSGVTGVNWDKQRNAWRSRIYYQEKTIELGYFPEDHIDEAIQVRKEAEEKYFGEWSYDNSMKEINNEI